MDLHRGQSAVGIHKLSIDEQLRGLTIHTYRVCTGVTALHSPVKPSWKGSSPIDRIGCAPL